MVSETAVSVSIIQKIASLVCGLSAESHMCLPAMFRCKRNHTCISYEHVCDGVPDCRDHSDELHCKYKGSNMPN